MEAALFLAAATGTAAESLAAALLRVTLGEGFAGLAAGKRFAGFGAAVFVVFLTAALALEILAAVLATVLNGFHGVSEWAAVCFT